ncbi:hypothetical protein AaE_001986 [Aphanomyces astaci]|uniref:Uncharacterized protein n=1 Tax=Aphanomyces astaci TaxID=112090 RepID=A0A6A5B078_APHAT|nr:hypothetical protein AaE_001986 [Aphanomyces astaci]
MFARQTLRALAAPSGVPKTTLVLHLKEEQQLRARSSYVRPHLTAPAPSEARHILPPTNVTKNQVFADMNSYIHVDETWFFLTKVKMRFYAYEDEVIHPRLASCGNDHSIKI